MSPRAFRPLALAIVCLALSGAALAEPIGSPPSGADPWALPDAGSCAPAGGLRGVPEDAGPVPFKTGDAFEITRVETLKNFLPRDFWAHREKFFYEGMRLEIGPCFRDYGPPDFFVEATRANAGKAQLLPNGGLAQYAAGAPFPIASIAPSDLQAGLEFAWDFEHRYQAAGFRGPFRRVDLLGKVGHAEPFEGELFKILLSHRADRPPSAYEAPGANGKHWVGGGLFFKPFDSREFAWRQYRDREHEAEPRRSDDLHAYLPQWRRVRRISAANVEGIYMPAPSVGVQPNQQLAVGTGGGEAGGVGSAGGAGVAGGSITPRNTGFEGLEIRPLLWDWKVLGVHDVLAPINLTKPLYPESPDREFGPWGLSFASDVWDLRRAIVLEATAKQSSGGEEAARLIQYLDLQTLHPLYFMSFDSRNEPIDVGTFAGRWSEDRPEYPRWPDDPARPVRVIDSVGAAVANLSERGSWRRESWTHVAVPPDDGTVKKLLSVSNLTKRH